MNTENAGDRTQWISLHKREPNYGFHVMYGGYAHDGRWVCGSLSNRPDNVYEYTHWLEIKLPPPPPRAKTLAEEDVNAFDSWNAADRCPMPFSGRREAWHAAIAYEREQIAKICASDVGYDSKLLASVYDRVKGTK